MTDGVKKIVNHSDPDMRHFIKRAREQEQGSGFDGVIKNPEPKRVMFGDPKWTEEFDDFSGRLDAAIAGHPPHIQANIAALAAEHKAAAAAEAPDDYRGADGAAALEVRGHQPRPAAQPVGRVNEGGPPIKMG